MQVLLISKYLGLTSGVYAGRAELKPIIFAGTLEDKGGLLVKTSIVENYPGFSSGVLGFDLITEMEKQAKSFGIFSFKSNY